MLFGFACVEVAEFEEDGGLSEVLAAAGASEDGAAESGFGGDAGPGSTSTFRFSSFVGIFSSYSGGLLIFMVDLSSGENLARLGGEGGEFVGGASSSSSTMMAIEATAGTISGLEGLERGLGEVEKGELWSVWTSRAICSGKSKIEVKKYREIR